MDEIYILKFGSKYVIKDRYRKKSLSSHFTYLKRKAERYDTPYQLGVDINLISKRFQIPTDNFTTNKVKKDKRFNLNT